MDNRKCVRCRAVLTMRNPGFICLPCQEKFLDDWASASKSRNLDVEDMCGLLGLESQEQVKRLARNRKLPRRIPAIKKWLWEDDVVRDWMRSGYEMSDDVKKQIKALSEAHGGTHVDEATGETEVGDKVDIQVMVYSKKSKRSKKIVRETKKKSFVIPRHHE